MATYHLSARIIKRSQNKSAVAASAYRSGDKFYDEREDKIWNYSSKEVAYSEILAPEYTGQWANDRSDLWNTIQNKERQWKNGQLARDIEIALPRELSLQQNIELVTKYAQSNFVDKGMIADINIHESKASDGSTNPHVHIMLTMKEVDKKTGELKSAKNRNWNKKDLLKEWRVNWADSVNSVYAEKGIDEKIDHRTLEEQGIEREPQIHVGFASNDIEQKDGYAERFTRNEEIKERNRLMEIAIKAKEMLQEQYKKAVAWVMREEKNMSEDDIRVRDYGFELNNSPAPPDKQPDKGLEMG